MKAGVILGGYLGVLTLGALLGWAPYADAASSMTILNASLSCTDGEDAMTLSFQGQSNPEVPYKWEVINSDGLVAESGSGTVLPSETRSIKISQIGAVNLYWPKNSNSWDYKNNPLNSSNVAKLSAPINCGVVIVTPTPTPVVTPVVPAVTVANPRVEIAGRTYEVVAMPTTLRELTIKLIWLLEQKFDLER